MALAVTLCGYAIFGKGFAYLGLPPLYIGEILLCLGVLALLFSGCLLSTLTNLTNLLLAALCLLVVIRTVPFIGIHGVDALRDSVLVLYGAFAFVACGLLLQRPSRLPLILGLFGTFALIYGAYAWVPYVLALVPQLVPAWPGSGLPLVNLRPGEVAVHLAGTTVFALLFFPRVNWLWLLLLLAVNFFNQLDLRPGRTLKVFLATVLLIYLLTGGPGSLLAGIGLGAAAGVLGGDLKGRWMLGDTGANLVGALTGLSLIMVLPWAGRIAAFLALVFLNLAGELWSLNRIIQGNLFLRVLDNWGRNRGDKQRIR
jgi:hypothetical protein